MVLRPPLRMPANQCRPGVYTFVDNCLAETPTRIAGSAARWPATGSSNHRMGKRREKGCTGEITAHLVKAAVRELQKAQPQITAKPPPKPTKLHKRRLLESKIGEVPVLLTQKADYATLTQSNQPRITRMTRMDLITKKRRSSDTLSHRSAAFRPPEAFRMRHHGSHELNHESRE